MVNEEVSSKVADKLLEDKIKKILNSGIQNEDSLIDEETNLETFEFQGCLHENITPKSYNKNYKNQKPLQQRNILSYWTPSSSALSSVLKMISPFQFQRTRLQEKQQWLSMQSQWPYETNRECFIPLPSRHYQIKNSESSSMSSRMWV